MWTKTTTGSPRLSPSIGATRYICPLACSEGQEQLVRQTPNPPARSETFCHLHVDFACPLLEFQACDQNQLACRPGSQARVTTDNCGGAATFCMVQIFLTPRLT